MNVSRSGLTLILAALTGAAQAPVVGDINYYGLHRTSPAQVLHALRLESGTALPPSKGEMEDALEKLPNVVLGRIEAMCCEGRRVTLFIGLEERGEPHAAFRTPPSGAATLPPDIATAYDGFVTAVQRAAARGNTAEDLTAGHSMMSDPEPRSFQAQFASFASQHVPLVREVLRNGAEPEQRAIAAVLVGYAPNKRDILDDLQYALQDPDESVRANAIRSLKAVAVLAAREPALGIKISPTWLIELLNSIVLSDRVESVNTLLTLTDRGEQGPLEQIRETALPAVVEMARWKTPRYALPPFVLAGRVAGLTDPQIHQSWEKGDRDAVLDKALAPPSRKRG